MDTFSSWLHNVRIDRALDRLGTYADPSVRMTLLQHLITEYAKLGDGPDQLNHTARRIREGRARIDKTLMIIEGLIAKGLMDQEQYSKALSVFATMHDCQVLLEQLHRRMSEIATLNTRRQF